MIHLQAEIRNEDKLLWTLLLGRNSTSRDPKVQNQTYPAERAEHILQSGGGSINYNTTACVCAAYELRVVLHI
jgi:hypothetical protein